MPEQIYRCPWCDKHADFLRRLLNPEDLGLACTEEVHAEARKLLGISSPDFLRAGIEAVERAREAGREVGRAQAILETRAASTTQPFPRLCWTPGCNNSFRPVGSETYCQKCQEGGQ